MVKTSNTVAQKVGCYDFDKQQAMECEHTENSDFRICKFIFDFIPCF